MSLLGRIRARQSARGIRAALDELIHLMGADTSSDERGLFVRGFRSQAIAVRADESPPLETWPWYLSEGAKLILSVIEEDKAGDRSLASFIDDDYGIEDEIIRRAKGKASGWALDSLGAAPA